MVDPDACEKAKRRLIPLLFLLDYYVTIDGCHMVTVESKRRNRREIEKLARKIEKTRAFIRRQEAKDDA